MGEGPRVDKRWHSGCSERLKQKPDTSGVQRGPSKATGLQRLLVLEPSNKIFTQPESQPAYRSESGFTSSSKKWFSRISKR